MGPPHDFPDPANVEELQITGSPGPPPMNANGSTDSPLPPSPVLTSLCIKSGDFREFKVNDIVNFANRFGKAINTLRLDKCHVNSAVLIMLTSLFPQIEDLRVHGSKEEDNQHFETKLELSEDGIFKIPGYDIPLNLENLQKLSFIFLLPQHLDFIAFVSKKSSGLHSIAVSFHHEFQSGKLQELFDSSKDTLVSTGVWSWKKGKLISV